MPGNFDSYRIYGKIWLNGRWNVKVTVFGFRSHGAPTAPTWRYHGDRTAGTAKNNLSILGS